MERFHRSIKSECLERMILFGEPMLRNAIREYLVHYHHERNHQGLQNRIIDPRAKVAQVAGHIQCRERLSGLLRYLDELVLWLAMRCQEWRILVESPGTTLARLAERCHQIPGMALQVINKVHKRRSKLLTAAIVEEHTFDFDECGLDFLGTTDVH